MIFLYVQKICVNYQLLVTWELLWQSVWIVDSPHMRYNPGLLGLCQNKIVSLRAVFSERFLAVKHLFSLS